MQGVEAEWDHDHGRYKLYPTYRKEMSGNDVGVWFTFDTKPGEVIYVQTGVSFVSAENALLNLDTEQRGFDFAAVRASAEDAWEQALRVVEVEGGTQEQRTVFYTALYHLLIHPNILQDVNGEYPMMASLRTGKTSHDRYTVYSLWDTYRNVHPLLSLLYPRKQLAMVQSMLDMYREGGWLPKWELYGQETLTMEGDPSLIVINDTWQRGIRDFDVNLAYEAMLKGATTPGKDNLMRPDNDDYLSRGYVPLREKFDNSVSHALEYYLADWNLSQFARSLGKKKDADLAMDAAACIGCGACAAACKNGSAMLFVSAKVSQLALLPQGRVEATRRAKAMVAKMDELGFGNCTNTGACEAECPKSVSITHIARLNRQYIGAKFKD